MHKNKKNYIRLSFVSRTDNALPFHVCLVEINIMIMTLCTTIKKFLLGNYNCKLFLAFALQRYILSFLEIRLIIYDIKFGHKYIQMLR